MGRYRKIDPRIWNDAKFSALSNEAQRTFIFVLTHPMMTGIGTFRTTIGGMADELRIDPKGFREVFQELLSKGLVKYDEKGCLIYAPNFMKYNEPENANVVKGWMKVLEYLPECTLLLEALGNAISVAQRFSSNDRALETIRVFERVSERLSKEFGKPFEKGLAKDSTKGIGIQRAENREQINDAEGGVADSVPSAPAPAPVPSPSSAKKIPAGQTGLVSEILPELPDDLRQYTEQRRPDLDPEVVFVDFTAYFTTNQTRKNLKNWRLAYQGWVRREKTPDPKTVPQPKPKELTPEERHEYKRNIAKMYGFPDQYVEQAVAGTYSAEPTNAMLKAILSTKQSGGAA